MICLSYARQHFIIIPVGCKYDLFNRSSYAGTFGSSHVEYVSHFCSQLYHSNLISCQLGRFVTQDIFLFAITLHLPLLLLSSSQEICVSSIIVEQPARTRDLPVRMPKIF